MAYGDNNNAIWVHKIRQQLEQNGLDLSSYRAFELDTEKIKNEKGVNVGEVGYLLVNPLYTYWYMEGYCVLNKKLEESEFSQLNLDKETQLMETSIEGISLLKNCLLSDLDKYIIK